MKVDGPEIAADFLEAALAFLGTFDTSLKVGNGEDLDVLCDFLLQCLNQICPDSFPVNSFESIPQLISSRGAAVVKISKLGYMLDAYFRMRCHKSVAGLPLDAEAIVGDRDSIVVLLYLVELVVGAAVLCDNRAVFIK